MNCGFFYINKIRKKIKKLFTIWFVTAWSVRKMYLCPRSSNNSKENFICFFLVVSCHVAGSILCLIICKKSIVDATITGQIILFFFDERSDRHFHVTLHRGPTELIHSVSHETHQFRDESSNFLILWQKKSKVVEIVSIFLKLK